MSSTSSDRGAAASHHIPPIAAMAAAQPPHGKLSLDDISKYFHLPIAEAATNLGVCTSVLKRICRENGIIRWPYRKYLAGKTFDDIKREAAREKAKELSQFSGPAKQNLDASKMVPSTSVGLATFGNQTQNRGPGQQGVSIQGNRNFQPGWPSTIQNQTRHIPTYFDDFKYGFPANGLSSASYKWWGTSNVESDLKVDSTQPATKEEENKDSCKLTEEPSRCMIDEQTDRSSLKDSALTTEPSASLVSLRKRALECGRKSLTGIPSCEAYRLSKRKKLLLFQVFRSSFPDQWKDSFS